jgi:hypothetical protein
MQRPDRHGYSIPPEVPGQPEEVLVADARNGLTPADMVERKLLFLLRGASVAGSHLSMGGAERPRQGGINGSEKRTDERGRFRDR